MTAGKIILSIFFVRVFCILVLVLPIHIKAQETITINSGEWPPYLAENTPHYGFFSHIVTSAFQLESIKIDYKFKPWKRTFEEAKLGLVNASIGWSKTPEREENFIFSDPIIIGESVFFHLKAQAVNWQNFNDLTQYSIGGTLGYEYKFEHEPGLTIERVANDEINFRKLLKGRTMILPSDKEAGYMILNKHFRAEQISKITYNRKAYDQTSYRLIFPKNHPDSERLVALFNIGLKKLRQSGMFAQIIHAQEAGEYSNLLISENL